VKYSELAFDNKLSRSPKSRLGWYTNNNKQIFGVFKRNCTDIRNSFVVNIAVIAFLDSAAACGRL